jgi:hypothetical protein
VRYDERPAAVGHGHQGPKAAISLRFSDGGQPTAALYQLRVRTTGRRLADRVGLTTLRDAMCLTTCLASRPTPGRMCGPSSASWRGFRWRSSWLRQGSRHCRWRNSSRAWVGRSTRSRPTRSRVTRGIARCGLSSAGATTLLAARDPDAFAALSVFAGSFNREAASAVVADDGSDAVDRLLGRSLLTRDIDLVGQARYRFLDPVRHIAEEMAMPTSRDRAYRRYVDYHVGLATRINGRIQTAEATAWATVARACSEDLRRAVAYAISEHSASVGRLVADLYWPWFLDGQLSELRSWADDALSTETDPHARARLLRILASTALAQGDAAIAVDYACRQLDAATALPDLELVALTQNLLGMAAWSPGRLRRRGRAPPRRHR